MLSAYSSGSLVQQQGVYFVFGITAIFPLIVSASALLIDERPRPALITPSTLTTSAAASSAAAAGVGGGWGQAGDDSSLSAAAVAEGGVSGGRWGLGHREGGVGGKGESGAGGRVIDVLPDGSWRQAGDDSSAAAVAAADGGGGWRQTGDDSSAVAAAASSSSRTLDSNHTNDRTIPPFSDDPESPWLRDPSDLSAAATAAAAGSSSSSSSTAAVAAGSRHSSPWIMLKAQVVSQGLVLWSALKQKHILLPTVFVFLWQATPSADTAMFYFYTNELKFDAEFLGWVRLAGSVAALVGVGLYNTKFKKVGKNMYTR